MAADREGRLEDETILAEEGSSQVVTRSKSIENAAEEGSSRVEARSRSIENAAEEGGSRAAARSRAIQNAAEEPHLDPRLPEVQLHPPDGLGLILSALAHELPAPTHARALHSKHAYHHTNLVQHARTHMHTPRSPAHVTKRSIAHRCVCGAGGHQKLARRPVEERRRCLQHLRCCVKK